MAEDVGDGDLTATMLADDDVVGASIIAREALLLAGQPWVNEVFRQLDASILIDWYVSDGQSAEDGDVICKLVGDARALLTGERTALNFLQTLSGTATTTASFVTAVEGTQARVLDTRKTLPGLRRAQKYAVRMGGGENHRVGLVEVESVDELHEALKAGATRILLDNFSIEALAEAIDINGAHGYAAAELEASGNITLDNVRSIAETGVDFISVGALTKNIAAVDLSMLFRID